MTTISYTNPALHYAGRWIDYGDSKGSGWHGAQIRFRVTGSNSLTFTAKVSAPDSSFMVINIDGGPKELRYFSAVSFTGIKTVNFVLPSTGSHTIVAKLVTYPDPQFAQTSYVRLMSIDVDTGATIAAWGGSAQKKIEVVGDSWMGAENDWPIFMDTSIFAVYPVAYGGATAAQLAAKYPYDVAGTLNTAGPLVDAVIVNSSVNDYNGGVGGATFQASMQTLVDLIRAKHPAAKIFLVQSPRNINTGASYDIYGANMAAIAAATANCIYVPVTSEVWGVLTWSDTAHLSYASRKVFAGHVTTQVSASLGVIPPSAGVNEIFFKAPSGLINVPLKDYATGDELTDIVVSINGILRKLKTTDVYPPYPENAVLVALDNRVCQLT